MLASAVLTLTPTPPFDFNHTLEYLADFAISTEEQLISGGTLTRAFPFGGTILCAEICSTGTVEAPELRVTVHYEPPHTTELLKRAEERISAFLSLGVDLAPFYQSARFDETFWPIARSLYGYHPVRFPTPFEAACWAVLAQRNTFPVTLRTKTNLVQRFGCRIELGGRFFPTFPEPERLARVDTATLLDTLRNSWKVNVIQSVTQGFLEMDEEFMLRARFDEARRWLMTIDGIGDWSASFILLRGFGRMEQAPVRDRKLLETASRVYGGFPSPADLQKLADPYGPQQGCWAHYLRVAAG